jgi:hypothetical protein
LPTFGAVALEVEPAVDPVEAAPEALADVLAAAEALV